MEHMPERDAMQYVRKIKYYHSDHSCCHLLVEVDSKARRNTEWALASRKSLREGDVNAEY